jgi:hypothetical protein
MSHTVTLLSGYGQRRRRRRDRAGELPRARHHGRGPGQRWGPRTSQIQFDPSLETARCQPCPLTHREKPVTNFAFFHISQLVPVHYGRVVIHNILYDKKVIDFGHDGSGKPVRSCTFSSGQVGFLSLPGVRTVHTQSGLQPERFIHITVYNQNGLHAERFLARVFCFSYTPSRRTLSEKVRRRTSRNRRVF